MARTHHDPPARHLRVLRMDRPPRTRQPCVAPQLRQSGRVSMERVMGEDRLTFDYSAPSDKSDRHIWSLVGPEGGVHIWARRNDDEFAERFGARFIGGIEVHRRAPSEWQSDYPSSHDDCWLIGGPCWHDGTSLYFSERIGPFLNPRGNLTEANHEFVRGEISDWYRSQFTSDGTP